jgi:hypothetical protein
MAGRGINLICHSDEERSDKEESAVGGQLCDAIQEIADSSRKNRASE